MAVGKGIKSIYCPLTNQNIAVSLRGPKGMNLSYDVFMWSKSLIEDLIVLFIVFVFYPDLR